MYEIHSQIKIILKLLISRNVCIQFNSDLLNMVKNRTRLRLSQGTRWLAQTK